MSLKLAFSNGFNLLSGSNHKCHGRGYLPCKMEMKLSPIGKENDYSDGQRPLVKPQEEIRTSELQFTKLQQINREINQDCRYFGDYVAREALLDEEYWTAAWLRAESHWEDRASDRYAESYKRQFAEQEFNALKRKSQGYNGQKSACIVAVKRQDKNAICTVIKSVVGTLDLTTKYLLQGSFPGEKVKTSLLGNIKRKETSKYGYVSNLCVAKSARRKGIAVNMLTFAIQSAKSNGAKMIFVHVHRKNTRAQLLYQKLGFEIVDEASPNLQQEQMYLLSIRT